MSSRMLLPFLAAEVQHWLMLHLLSTGTLRSFSVKPLWSSSCLAHSMYWCMDSFLPRCRTWHFPLFELYEVPVGPLLQPIEVPPNSSTTIWSIRSSSQFYIICKLAEGELYPIILITEEVCQCGVAVICAARLLALSLTLLWAKPDGTVSVLTIACQLSLALKWSHTAWMRPYRLSSITRSQSFSNMVEGYTSVPSCSPHCA